MRNRDVAVQVDAGRGSRSVAAGVGTWRRKSRDRPSGRDVGVDVESAAVRITRDLKAARRSATDRGSKNRSYESWGPGRVKPAEGGSTQISLM